MRQAWNKVGLLNVLSLITLMLITGTPVKADDKAEKPTFKKDGLYEWAIKNEETKTWEWKEVQPFTSDNFKAAEKLYSKLEFTKPEAEANTKFLSYFTQSTKREDSTKKFVGLTQLILEKAADSKDAKAEIEKVEKLLTKVIEKADKEKESKEKVIGVHFNKKDEDKAESESNLKGLKELLKAIKELDPKDFKDVEDMKKFVAKFFAKNEEVRKALGMKLGKDIEVKKEEPKKEESKVEKVEKVEPKLEPKVEPKVEKPVVPPFVPPTGPTGEGAKTAEVCAPEKPTIDTGKLFDYLKGLVGQAAGPQPAQDLAKAVDDSAGKENKDQGAAQQANNTPFIPPQNNDKNDNPAQPLPPQQQPQVQPPQYQFGALPEGLSPFGQGLYDSVANNASAFYEGVLNPLKSQISSADKMIKDADGILQGADLNAQKKCYVQTQNGPQLNQQRCFGVATTAAGFASTFKSQAKNLASMASSVKERIAQYANDLSRDPEVKQSMTAVLKIQELSKEEKDLQTRMSAEQAKAGGNQEIANSVQAQFQPRLDQIKNLKKEAEQVLALTKPTEQKKLDNFRKDVEGANTLVAQLETKESDLNEKARLASTKGDDAESLVYGSMGGNKNAAQAGPLLGSGTRGRTSGNVPGFAAARGGAAGSQTVRGNLGPLSAKAQAT